MNMTELPANRIALAHTIRAVAKGRPKPLRAHLETAEIIMMELRDRGFRVVPFPPLKNTHKRTGRRLKRSRLVA